MASTQMGKIARHWENRDKRSHSLTQVTDRLIKKIIARMKRPKHTRANRIDVLIGDSGIGKSTVLRKLADRLSVITGDVWKAKLWHVATQGFEDNTGLPIIEEHQVNGKMQKVATFAKADHVPGAVWQPHYTLGILDELPTAPPLIQNQLREMIDGQINGSPIDPKCLLIGTGNPPDARFVTVNALDNALEKRLKIYIVIPTKSELLEVWSQIMPDLIYKFLMMHQEFIDAISPREWEGVSKDVQDLVDGGGTLQEAAEEATDALIEYPNIEVKLRQWLQWGDDPRHYPLRGLQIMKATDNEMATYQGYLEHWLQERNLRGLAGQSAQDLVRTLNLTAEEELKKDEDRIARNVTQFLIPLAELEANDMAKTILEVVMNGVLVSQICLNLKANKKTLKAMSEALKRFHLMRSKISAVATG
ncbi:hypothetical protein LCGC14_0850970 [marine sediment metagenome]|uniref:ATPase dynein-related AAA domain-containing protein n=1 Tax=marine sediment metagenome TaxID=412755 RepID=A0A0F9PAD2_9ZZZZ